MKDKCLQLSMISCDRIKWTWPLARSWIMAAAEKAEEYDEYSIVGRLLRGDLYLFVAVENNIPVGALTVEIIDFPIKKVAFILHLGGDISTMLQLLPELEEWSRAMGANYISLLGRKGFSRLLPQHGFYEKFTVMEKDLWADQHSSQTQCQSSWPHISPMS